MIGISCTAFSSDSPEKWLDKIVGNFELWEIFSEASHSVVYNRDIFAELLPSYDLHYSIHAPICDINVASISDPVREASLKEIIDTIRVASDLGVDRVTVHPGISSMSVRGIEDRYLAHGKESMKAIDKASREYGVRIAVENMPYMYFFLCYKAKDLADLIDGTDLGVCFDIGHANTAGEIDSMIELLGDRLENIHIHDNNGDRDAHMTIGEGSIDFQHVIKALGSYDKNYVIESKSYESALESQSVLESMLSS